MARVFISYRRQVSAGHARALYDRVAQRFPGQVFMDVAGSIAPGVDFVDAIEKAIGSCRVLLVMIGRDWADQENRQRLDDPNDFVRLEIAAALSRRVIVVPVLVEEARMPTASELPKDIARLARIQAIELRDTRWDADVDTLISELERMIQESSTSSSDSITTSEPARSPRKSSSDAPVGEDPHHVARPRPTESEDRAASSKHDQARRSRLVPIALGLVVLFAAALGGYLWLGSRGDEVPNLVGLLVDRAEQRLQSEGLALGKVTVQRSLQARSREVLEQSPLAGTKATRGMTVALVVAGAPVVPNVVGKDLETARTELRTAGFEIRVKPEPTDRSRSRPNTVLRVTPPAGTEVSEKSPAVEVVVAAALDVGITVPNVIGKVSGDAMRQLRDAGFFPQGRAGTRNSRIAELQVVAQDPAPGGRLAKGGVVAFEYNPQADANAPPPSVLNIVILYPGNRRQQAEDIAQLFVGRAFQVSAKSNDASARGGRVVYFVRSDAPSAQGIAARATDWLEKQAGQQGRSFKAEFETPQPGTIAAEGGSFIIYTY